MKKAIVVGSGAGGATVARELQGEFQVTLLEEGGEFKPFSLSLSVLEKLRKTGLFIDEREIQLLFPAMRIAKTDDKIVMVHGKGLGGTTTISAGNALRQDGELKKLGIDLDDEFSELYSLIPITKTHREKWSETTGKLYNICDEMGLNPSPIPKFGNYSHCTKCGQCVLGCKYGVKWDSRHFVSNALTNGAEIITGCKVSKVIISNGKATGVLARRGLKSIIYPADIIVLAAGGFSTPVILQNSGIPTESKLFVDPVLCVAAQWRDSLQNNELSMPFAVKKEHFIISPYFDFLSFFFNKEWNYPAKNILTMMIKLADSNIGSIENVNIDKALNNLDKERLTEGIEICTEIMTRLGVHKKDIFLGTINAGHPGGTLPLTVNEAETFHNPKLPSNLYVADATLFPASLGNPPILTIMAMAKKIGKIINEL